MAYINLKLIGELAIEALTNYDFVESFCYNADRKGNQLPDNVFVVQVKTYRQAENLQSKLTRLNRICTDFASGNFDSYIIDFNEYKETEDEVFDPFEVLESCFGSFSVDDLPRQIEQYKELLTLSHHFAEVQQYKRDTFQKSFGKHSQYYQAKEENGETVMIPESELPESVRRQQAVNREITDVEVEYCLDGYNDFYTHATGLLSAFSDGDIKGCAEAILSLFSRV